MTFHLKISKTIHKCKEKEEYNLKNATIESIIFQNAYIFKANSFSTFWLCDRYWLHYLKFWHIWAKIEKTGSFRGANFFGNMRLGKDSLFLDVTEFEKGCHYQVEVTTQMMECEFKRYLVFKNIEDLFEQRAINCNSEVTNKNSICYPLRFTSKESLRIESWNTLSTKKSQQWVRKVPVSIRKNWKIDKWVLNDSKKMKKRELKNRCWSFKI